MKIVTLSLVILYLGLFIAFVAIVLGFEVSGIILPISPFFYWFLVPGWIALIFNLKLKSEISFKVAIVLYIISAALTVLGIRQSGISEVLFRLSFVGLAIGLAQAILELKHD